MIQLSNLQPDPQDSRDYLFEADYDVDLPDEVDLFAYGGWPQNQLSAGSCTAQSTVKMGEMYRAAAGLFQDTPADDDGDLAARFNYFTSRELLGPQFLEGDPGSTLRMALRAANKLGISREKFCPYDAEKINERPSAEAYADALNYRVGEYLRIPVSGNDDMIHKIMYALAKGWPVMVAMRVGQKLRDLPAGTPYSFINPTTNPYWGNHAWVIGGYKRLPDRVMLKCVNSWGQDWCEGGYFRCSALVAIVDLIDMWVVRSFAGIDSVGADLTKPKPAPEPVTPVPEVVPPPKPDPVPVPPAPPEPPKPQPDKSDKAILIASSLVLIAIATKIFNLW